MFKLWQNSKADSTESIHQNEHTNECAESENEDDTTPVSEALARILRVFGRHAFDLDQVNAEDIEKIFEHWAMHVLVGTPVVQEQDEQVQGVDGQRDWGGLSQFVNSHRQHEAKYVTHSLQDLRDVLWTFTYTIGRAVAEDQAHDRHMTDQLSVLKVAAESNSPEEMKKALRSGVEVIGKLVDNRSQHQQARLEKLGEKLKQVEAELGSARKQMVLDPLTRLYNRAALDMQMERLSGLSVLSGSPASLLMVDIDHFKEVNDTYGHRFGDAVLRQLADCLVSTFPRKNDFIARYGGEEFSVIFQGEGIHVSRRLAERLLKAVRNTTFQHDGTEIQVTVSIGAAELLSGNHQKIGSSVLIVRSTKQKREVEIDSRKPNDLKGTSLTGT